MAAVSISRMPGRYQRPGRGGWGAGIVMPAVMLVVLCRVSGPDGLAV